MFNGRKFLLDSPSTTCIAWQAEIRDNEEYVVPKHFYGKFTFCHEGRQLGIHSYGEHGVDGCMWFLDKCNRVVSAIDDFLYAINREDYIEVSRMIALNPDNTPFSGTIYYNLSVTPSGKEVCLFEISSCKQKIRIHASDTAVGGHDNFCKLLEGIRDQVKQLMISTRQVAEVLEFKC